jgi:hypothetical protein
MSADPNLALRRHESQQKTVSEVLRNGWRLQAVCMACNHRPLVDLRALERRGYGDRRLNDLKFSCSACARRRKVSIRPPGKDVYISVLFVGDQPSTAPGPSPF